MKSTDSDKSQFDDLKRTIAKLSSDKIDLTNNQERFLVLSYFLRHTYVHLLKTDTRTTLVFNAEVTTA